MSEEVNKEQTKDAKQDEITERSDDQLDEAAGGRSQDTVDQSLLRGDGSVDDDSKDGGTFSGGWDGVALD